MNKTTSLEIKLPDETYNALQRAAARAHKTEAELARDLLQSALEKQGGVLGLFADEPELVDALLADAMDSREITPLRIPEDNGGQSASGYGHFV